jgi:hypothetical protein
MMISGATAPPERIHIDFATSLVRAKNARDFFTYVAVSTNQLFLVSCRPCATRREFMMMINPVIANLEQVISDGNMPPSSMSHTGGAHSSLAYYLWLRDGITDDVKRHVLALEGYINNYTTHAMIGSAIRGMLLEVLMHVTRFESKNDRFKTLANAAGKLLSEKGNRAILADYADLQKAMFNAYKSNKVVGEGGFHTIADRAFKLGYLRTSGWALGHCYALSRKPLYLQRLRNDFEDKPIYTYANVHADRIKPLYDSGPSVVRIVKQKH